MNPQAQTLQNQTPSPQGANAISQSNDFLTKIMQANPMANTPSQGQVYPVATLANGQILMSDGSLGQSAAQNQTQNLQKNTFTQLAPQLMQQMGQYQNGVDSTLPMQARQQMSQQMAYPTSFSAGQQVLSPVGLDQNGFGFNASGNAPQAIMQNITQNANLQQNLPSPLFNLSQLNRNTPQDPTVSFLQRSMQNNPQFQNVYNQGLGTVFGNGAPAVGTPQFGAYDRQAYNPLVRQIISQYGNYNVAPQSQQITPQSVGQAPIYSGVNQLTNRII